CQQASTPPAAPAASAASAASVPVAPQPESAGAPPPPEEDFDGLLPPMSEWALPDDASLPEGARLLNYGGAAQPWIAKLRRLAAARGKAPETPAADAPPPEVLRIVVLGDSHTAGGFMTDALRHRLQARLGNAGPGWAQAARIKGQNTSVISYAGWTPSSSRHNDPGEFTVGGVNATSDGGELHIGARAWGPMQLSFIARSDNPGVPLYVREAEEEGADWLRAITASERPGWQLLTLERPVRAPLLVRDPLARWTLAAVGMDNGWPGATVSAFGINGAQISEIAKWHKDWTRELALTRADLVALEYGTNEVWGRGEVPWNALERHWQRQLAAIRAALPQAGILIIAPPGAIQSQDGDCGQPPPHLAEMQALQQRLAKQHRALYWSWQDAMGGACSMKRWQDAGLAMRDGVHLTREGYWRTGGLLADAILALGGEGQPKIEAK
ncbi:MAG: hypothetical protein IKH84_06485, partial [Ottowia sp.]|nr:hypothetical protein [Ottowia sp.]